jgi:hypothetical protein
MKLPEVVNTMHFSLGNYFYLSCSPIQMRKMMLDSAKSDESIPAFGPGYRRPLILDRLSLNAGWGANNCSNLSKDFKPSNPSMVASSASSSPANAVCWYRAAKLSEKVLRLICSPKTA